MIVVFALHAKDFEIGFTDFLTMALVCLVCLPNAVNLPKTLSGKVKYLPDLVSMASALLDNKGYMLLLAEIAQRVYEEMNLLEPTGQQWQQLATYRQRLMEEQEQWLNC
jgi:hypothetical protein